MNITEELFKTADARFNNSAYTEADEEQNRLIKQLSKELSDENLEIFNRIIHCACIMESEYACDMFAAGLSLGVQLTAECFSAKL